MLKIKKLLLTALLVLLPTSAFADYTFVVPQKPGAGTSQWAAIVAKELGKFTDKPIKILHLPGARDIPGFNAFHNEKNWPSSCFRSPQKRSCRHCWT